MKMDSRFYLLKDYAKIDKTVKKSEKEVDSNV